MVHIFTLPNGKEVKVTAKNKRVAKKFFDKEHYAYTLTVEVDDKMLKTTYHDSVANYEKRRGATREMIENALYCVILDADSYLNAPNYLEFIDTFGYEDNNYGKRVFSACKATYDELYAMLTGEEVDALYKMVSKE